MAKKYLGMDLGLDMGEKITSIQHANKIISRSTWIALGMGTLNLILAFVFLKGSDGLGTEPRIAANQEYMKYFKDKKFILSFVIGLIFLGVSFVVNVYAVNYAARSASNSVTDLILSNTPFYNVDGIFVYGAVLLVLVIFLVCFLKPQRFPFILKSIALFTLIRSFFLSLTHISPYPEHIAISPSIFTTLFPSIFTGDDLFFSGHTGLPFLIALVFWDNPLLRTIFLAFSLLLSIVVLLGHLHYSIDVASAFFITFTIFMLAKSLFKRDWEILKNG